MDARRSQRGIPAFAGMTWTAATGGMDSRLRGNDVDRGIDGVGMTWTALRRPAAGGILHMRTHELDRREARQ